jgi:hypothetical protein
VLSDIVSLGDGHLAEGLRLLSSVKMVESKPPRLTQSFVEAWILQVGLANCEIRIEATGTEHRRFMLLSDRQVLILPFSINAVAKNETAHVEESILDAEFFEVKWMAAVKLS